MEKSNHTVVHTVQLSASEAEERDYKMFSFMRTKKLAYPLRSIFILYMNK